MSVRAARMKRELELLEVQPPEGISAWPIDDQFDHLEANILGPKNSPYQNGLFKLDIKIPQRYPFEPPNVQFMTPIYHPNIDSSGRICLDTLKMPPKGNWTPSLNVSTVLTTILLLLSEPNPDDGLMPDITSQYRSDYDVFVRTAEEWTKRYAMDSGNDKVSDINPKRSIEEIQAPSSKKPKLEAESATGTQDTLSKDMGDR